MVQKKNQKHKELNMPKQIDIEAFLSEEIIETITIKDSQEAKKILDKNKLGSNFVEDGRMNDCYNFLTIMGVSVVSVKQKNFSLKQISTDNEFIKNPNIIESKDYKETQNEYDKPDDKFPNENDPFYQLDDYRDYSETKTKAVNSIDKSDVLVDVIEDILKINLVNNSSVKQFKDLS